MTVDHVLALDVVLSDAARRALRAARARPRSPAGPAPARSRARSTASSRCSRSGTARPSPPAIRGSGGQSGGYRLDRLAGAAAGAGPRHGSSSARRARWRGHRGDVALVRAPRHRVIAVGHFASTAAAIDATEAALACDPAAVELMDRTILELARTEDRVPASCRRYWPATRARCCSSPSSGTPRRRRPPASTGWTALWQAAPARLHTLRAMAAADQARAAKVRAGGPGPADGGQRPGPAARSPSSRTPRSTRPCSADIPERFARGARAPRAARGLLRPLPRSAACTSAPSWTSPSPATGADDARGRRGGPRPGARVRRRQLQRARRRPGPQRVQRPCSATTLYEAMREVKRLFDPRQPDEPRQDRRRAADDRATCATAPPAAAATAATIGFPRGRRCARRPTAA